MAKLFVSYSRKDSVIAHKLIEAFKSIEQDVWVDWESIPPAVDWLEQIFRGIETADAFIFIVSPDSIASEVCNVEIGRAALNNKRIIPIVIRDVNPKDTNEIIRKLNWTFIRETDNFEEGLAKVKTAIELDLDWLEEHRRLQIRALEWHRKKDVSLLLRGRDLRNAQHMVQTYTSKDPIPTELQLKYVDHSRKTERNRTIAWIATAIAIVALAILSYTAYRQSVLATRNAILANQNAEIANKNAETARKNERDARKAQLDAETQREKALEQERIARDQERIAEAQRSAAKAQIYQIRTGELYTSTLLAIDSWQKSPSDEAEEILRKNIGLLPIPIAQVTDNASVNSVVQSSDPGTINSLEVSPNGNTFLTASGGVTTGAACMWNLKNGNTMFCSTSTTSVNDATFVLGGNSIAIADETGAVKILNAENGNVEREFNMGSPIRDLDTSADGKLLSIARENGNITIVNLQNAKDKGYNLKLTGTLTVSDFSSNGKQFAAASEAGTVTVWNLTTGKIYSDGRHRGEVFALRFSPNSRFVISGGADNYAVGFDTQTGEEVFRLLHSDWVKDIAFAQSGTWFVTASDDARVRVWDLSSGRERLIMFQDSAITHVKISADEKWIATTGEDNTVRVWSSYTGVEMLQIPLENHGVALGFSNDTKSLITCDSDGHISIWDISAMPTPVNYIEFDELTRISKFTSSGDSLIVSDANRVWILNAKDLSTLKSHSPGKAILELQNGIRDLVISPDSQWIAVSTYADEFIIYSLQTRIPIRISPSGIGATLAFSGDNSMLITGTNLKEGIVETWETKTGKLINSVNVGNPVLSIAAAPAGVAVGMTDKIILLDANAQQQNGEVQALGDNQYVAFNSDGSMLASAKSSGQIQLWKLANETFEKYQTLNKEQPYSIAFNPQGNVLAVTTVNNVYLIDTVKGEETDRISHKGIVYNVSFSSDGMALATASLKTIQLWDVATTPSLQKKDLIKAACSRVPANPNSQEWAALFGQEEYRPLCANLPVP